MRQQLPVIFFIHSRAFTLCHDILQPVLFLVMFDSELVQACRYVVLNVLHA
jgi:hypothetical protein